MSVKFTMPVKVIAAISKFASNDTSRGALCGVRFEYWPDHVNVVATNGRMLGVYAHPCAVEGGGTSGFTVNPEAMLAVMDPEGAPAEVSVGETGWVRFAGHNVAVEIKPIELEFPKWRLTIPKDPETPCKSLFLSRVLLKKLQECSRLLSSLDALEFYNHDANCLGPISVRIGVPEFYGVVMPMRVGRFESVPEWMKNELKVK